MRRKLIRRRKIYRYSLRRRRARGIFGNVGKNVKRLFNNALNILPMIL